MSKEKPGIPDPRAHFSESPKSISDRNDISIGEAHEFVKAVVRCLQLRRITHTMLADLMNAVRQNTDYFNVPEGSKDGEAFDEKFSISGEVAETIKILRTLRRSLFCPVTNKLKEEYEIEDARNVLTTSNQLISTLIKTQEKVVNMERFQAIEEATIDVLKMLQDDYLEWTTEISEYKKSGSSDEGPVLKKFLQAMEERLEVRQQ